MTTQPVLLTTAAGLVERAVSPWHRGLVKLRARGLDRRICAGEPTDGDRLIAARARDLIGRQHRSEVASWWHDVVLACDTPPATTHRAVLVSRAQVLPAKREICELVETLRSELPVSARGVAAATVLLTDGAGPVFRRRAPALDAVVRDVIAGLDPLTDVRDGLPT